jgi:signal transduction histidine kinase
MNRPFNSITARVVCAVAVILAIAGCLIGVALYRNVSHSAQEETRAQLNQRIGLLQASVELDEEGNLEFEPKQTLTAMPERWRIATADGKVLWASQWDLDSSSFVTQTKTILLGEPGGKALTSDDIRPMAAKSPGSPFGSYVVDDKHGKIEVRVSARESNAHAEEELKHLRFALGTIGPVSILALMLILGFFIKWQHAPLTGMSKQAAAIGPQNIDLRIGPVGSCVELVRLRESINSMVQRLGEGLERERQFSSMAAHELRTPLTQMRLGIEIALSKERSNPEYVETLRQSLNDIERLQNLVGNLLFLTRDHKGTGMRNVLALKEIVTQAMRSCGAFPIIATDLQSLNVRGNDELLECAVRNVLENALRYAPEKPAEIKASDSGKIIRLSIADSGSGIPEADRERIFEPLTRLDEARSIGEETKGFGLGLTVARYAMRACGGNLICKGRDDGAKGAQFEFSFEKSI